MIIRIKFDHDRPIGFRDNQIQSVKFLSIKGKQLQNEWSDSAQNQTRPSSYAFPGYQQSKMNELAWRHHFPIISIWEIF